MRRKDREMSVDFAKKVIEESPYGTLALIDQDKDRTYAVNLSIVRLENCLYFHSAKGGLKVDLLEEGKTYGLSFVSYVHVPNVFSRERLEALAGDPKAVGLLLSRVFTTEYSSAHVFGDLYLVEDLEEKRKAMEAICQKYTPDKMDFFDQAMEVGGPRVQVYGIHIREIYGKRKKLDSQGEELKWQREE